MSYDAEDLTKLIRILSLVTHNSLRDLEDREPRDLFEFAKEVDRFYGKK